MDHYVKYAIISRMCSALLSFSYPSFKHKLLHVSELREPKKVTLSHCKLYEIIVALQQYNLLKNTYLTSENADTMNKLHQLGKKIFLYKNCIMWVSCIVL